MPSVFNSPTLEHIDQAIDAEPEQPRGHLGMSSIAGDARTLWLKFRWSLPDKPAPRTRRIFSLGNVIEAEVVKYLKLAGFEVHADDGSAQYGFKDLGGHYAGSMDGVICGLPESNAWHVLEVKSVKADRFAALVKNGVKQWDPTYFGQMQCYMHHAGLTRALFAAYNKNTSDLHFERVDVDPMFGPAMREKAREIITGPIPESTYPDRTWYEIKKFKSEHYQRVYWSDELPPKPNCRNCRFAIADVSDGETRAAWGCKKKRAELAFEDQVAGCDDHNWISDLVNAPEIRRDEHSVTYNAEGVEFTNGPDQGPTSFNSVELVELSKVGY